jgi:hypothetical protein
MYGGGCRYLRIELEVQRRRGKEFTPTLPSKVRNSRRFNRSNCICWL